VETGPNLYVKQASGNEMEELGILAREHQNHTSIRRYHPHFAYYISKKGEGIVHAARKRWKNMNKVSLLEGGDGLPPF